MSKVQPSNKGDETRQRGTFPKPQDAAFEVAQPGDDEVSEATDDVKQLNELSENEDDDNEDSSFMLFNDSEHVHGLNHENSSLMTGLGKKRRQSALFQADDILQGRYAYQGKARERLHSARRNLILLALVEIFDVAYDLTVYTQFMSSGDLQIAAPVYSKLYTAVTILGLIATLQLFATRTYSAIQISRKLSKKANELEASMKRAKLVRDIVEMDTDSLEFRLFEAERSKKQIRSLIWSTVFEDICNLALLFYRILFFHERSLFGTVILNYYDLAALAVGCCMIGFKFSFIHDYTRSNANIKNMKKDLEFQSRTCASCLDWFEDVTENEVNAVVSIRNLLGRDVSHFPPHVLGDVAILRVLRFCDHNIHQSCRKLRKIMKYRIEHDLNDKFEDMIVKNQSYKDRPFPMVTKYLGFCDESMTNYNLSSMEKYLSMKPQDFRRETEFQYEFGVMLAYGMSMKRKRVAYAASIGDFTDFKVDVKDAVQKAKLESEISNGFGAHLICTKYNFINADKFAVHVYQVAKKLAPFSRTLANSKVFGTDPSEYANICPFLDAPPWEPSLSEVVGRHYILGIINNVSHWELEIIGQLEITKPECFDMLDPIRIWRFLKSKDCDRIKCENKLEASMKWFRENNISKIQRTIKENNHDLNNLTPMAQRFADLCGMKIGTFCNNTVMITVGDTNWQEFLKISLAEYEIMNIELREIMQSELFTRSISNRHVARVQFVFDGRSVSTKLFHALVPYLKCMVRMDKHYPWSGFPIVVYGMGHNALKLYENILKPFMNTKVTSATIMLEEDPQELAKYINIDQLPPGFLQ